MPTECSAQSFDFGTVEGRRVEAAFDGGLVTSDAGALLLGATDRAIRMMDRFALCFHDERRPQYIEHEVATLVGQRVFATTPLAPLLGKTPSQLTPGRITYDLRRLRLHGLIERIPKTHRYRITAKGLRIAIFYTRLYNRSLRTGLAMISPSVANPKIPMAKSIRAAETAVNNWYQNEKIAA